MFENYRKFEGMFVEKRLKIVKKLVDMGMSEQEIIDYFLYPRISKKEADFFILYACGEVCHSLPREKLNCFGCYCPHYELVVWNDGENDITGRCAMGSEYMTIFPTATGDHILDCSNCWFPHTEEEVRKSLRKIING